MPRCVVCNDCTETQEGPVKAITWDPKVNGYVCSTCRKESYFNLQDLDSDTPYGRGLERHDVLEVFGVGKVEESKTSD